MDKHIIILSKKCGKKKTLSEYEIIENKYLIMKKKTKKIIAIVNKAVLIIL